MSLRRDLAAGVRLLGGLPSFVRRPVGLAEARMTVRQRLERRPAAFLRVARSIYARAGNPNRVLLESAGCEYGDLEHLVDRNGVEGALEMLLQKGVYLTVDESKGRQRLPRRPSGAHAASVWLFARTGRLADPSPGHPELREAHRRRHELPGR